MEIVSHHGILVVRFNLAVILEPELRRLREPLLGLASGDSPRLLLDLSGVDYVGSAFLGVIIGLSRRAADHGGRLVLCNVNPALRPVFEPLPHMQARPDWRGPFLAGTLEEGLAVCGDRVAPLAAREAEAQAGAATDPVRCVLLRAGRATRSTGLAMPHQVTRSLVVIGLAGMLLGAIDPLEGSLLILPGTGLVALGALLGEGRRRQLVSWSLALVSVGVGALWVLSALGGIGGDTGRSNWWGLVLLPYAVGWVMGVAGAILTLVESFRRPGRPDRGANPV